MVKTKPVCVERTRVPATSICHVTLLLAKKRPDDDHLKTVLRLHLIGEKYMCYFIVRLSRRATNAGYALKRAVVSGTK